MIPVKRLNHAVLYVRDLDRSVDFYRRAFGFEEVAREGGRMAFLRAAARRTTTTSACSRSGETRRARRAGRPASTTSPGRSPTIDDLPHADARFAELGALTGTSDHGATKSLYGRDPDGNEFEIMWLVPRDQWGEHERRAVVEPLDLEAERRKYGQQLTD